MMNDHLMKAYLAVCFFVILLIAQSSATTVKSAEDLVNLFRGKQSTVNVEIDVKADLDFSTVSLSFPLGVKTGGTCVTYSGKLSGNGYSIKNLKMNNKGKSPEYSHAGLFCGLKNATITNLIIDSSNSFVGDISGALSVSVSGSLNVVNVSNQASVSGVWRVAGFIGYVTDINYDNVTISFDNCSNEGIVTGEQIFPAGFVGLFYNNSNLNIIISNCLNCGSVSGSGSSGGFIGSVSTNTNSQLSFVQSINKGNINGKTENVGGFLGIFVLNNRMNVSVLKCINNGTVTENGPNAGGFFGSILENKNSFVTISESVNYGAISNEDFCAGGMIGQFKYNTLTNLTILSCVNHGSITATKESIGGMIGVILINTESTVLISNCTNNGSINKAAFAGGITGSVTTNTHIFLTVHNCTNNGMIDGDCFLGGLISHFYSLDDNSIGFTMINSINKGSVKGARGMVSGLFCLNPCCHSNMDITVLNSINKGDVTGQEAFGITNIMGKGKEYCKYG